MESWLQQTHIQTTAEVLKELENNPMQISAAYILFIGRSVQLTETKGHETARAFHGDY